MARDLEKLNYLVDQAIEEVLRDTVDSFHAGDDPYKEPDYETLKNDDVEDLSHVVEPTITSWGRRPYNPQSDSKKYAGLNDPPDSRGPQTSDPHKYEDFKPDYTATKSKPRDGKSPPKFNENPRPNYRSSEPSEFWEERFKDQDSYDTRPPKYRAPPTSSGNEVYDAMDASDSHVASFDSNEYKLNPLDMYNSGARQEHPTHRNYSREDIPNYRTAEKQHIHEPPEQSRQYQAEIEPRKTESFDSNDYKLDSTNTYTSGARQERPTYRHYTREDLSNYRRVEKQPIHEPPEQSRQYQAETEPRKTESFDSSDYKLDPTNMYTSGARQERPTHGHYTREDLSNYRRVEKPQIHEPPEQSRQYQAETEPRKTESFSSNDYKQNPTNKSGAKKERPNHEQHAYEDLYSYSTDKKQHIDKSPEKGRQHHAETEPCKTQEEKLQEQTKPSSEDLEVDEKTSKENIEKLKKTIPHIIDRDHWGALPPMGDIKRIEAPPESIVFSMNTDTPPCDTVKECIRRVKEIQARHMGEGLADIQYNFLVGGDGNMYEGRGWGLESGVKREVGEGMNYNIAFIGNYSGQVDKVPSRMLGPVQDLVIYMKLNNLVLGDKAVTEAKSPKKRD